MCSASLTHTAAQDKCQSDKKLVAVPLVSLLASLSKVVTLQQQADDNANPEVMTGVMAILTARTTLLTGRLVEVQYSNHSSSMSQQLQAEQQERWVQDTRNTQCVDSSGKSVVCHSGSATAICVYTGVYNVWRCVQGGKL